MDTVDLLKVRDQEIFDAIQHSDPNTVRVKRTLFKTLAQLVFLIIQRQAPVVSTPWIIQSLWCNELLNNFNRKLRAWYGLGGWKSTDTSFFDWYQRKKSEDDFCYWGILFIIGASCAKGTTDTFSLACEQALCRSGIRYCSLHFNSVPLPSSLCFSVTSLLRCSLFDLQNTSCSQSLCSARSI